MFRFSNFQGPIIIALIGLLMILFGYLNLVDMDIEGGEIAKHGYIYGMVLAVGVSLVYSMILQIWKTYQKSKNRNN